MERQKIYVFDFDGTLTRRDSFLAFIRFVRGTAAFVGGFLLHAPLLVLMKLGLYSNSKAKERIFSYYFKGISLDEMGNFCRNFAHVRHDIMREDGLKTVQEKLDKGATVVILTASVDLWVREFFAKHDRLHVIGTQVAVVDGKLTGKFSTDNCYGGEKVRRLRTLFPDRSNYELIAFGDSRGDKELLDEADERHYKPFR